MEQIIYVKLKIGRSHCVLPQFYWLHLFAWQLWHAFKLHSYLQRNIPNAITCVCSWVLREFFRFCRETLQDCMTKTRKKQKITRNENCNEHQKQQVICRTCRAFQTHCDPVHGVLRGPIWIWHILTVYLNWFGRHRSKDLRPMTFGLVLFCAIVRWQ